MERGMTDRFWLSARFSTVLFFLGAALAPALLGGCPGNVMCIRAIRCVQVCGGPVLSSGCGPCGAGTFDDFRCLDAGTDAGAVDGGTAPDGGEPADGGTGSDAPVATSCSLTSECALRGATCCGSCGSTALGDFVALHVDEVGAYGSAVCAAEGFPPCARCDLPPDPYLAAVCRASACVGLDLRAEPLTECSTPTDCVLGPRTCCDCGALGLSETVAYNPARGSLGDYSCDEGAPACPPCVPSFVGVAADCVAGRCIALAAP